MPGKITLTSLPAGFSTFRLAPATSHGGARFEVTIPGWHPTTLNELMNCHVMKAGRLKDADKLNIAEACYRGNVTAAIGKRRVSLIVTYAKGARRHDKDAWWKSTLDALVRCQALRNDSVHWVEHGAIEYVRASERAFGIVLEDVT